jgi:anti-sigma factor RsiW
MTRRIPEGDSLAGLRNAADVLRHGFEVWPADADEQRIDDFLRRTRARPEWPRPRPWWIAALFLAAAFFAGAGLAVIVGDMIQTGAAAAVEAQRVAAW